MHERGAAVPRHIPLDRVVDVDVYALPGAEVDFLLAWKVVQDAAPASIVWSPRNGGHWIATRGREIAVVFEDHSTFSSRVVLVPRQWAESYQVKPTTLDPPEHTDYRRILNAALTNQTVAAARPIIRAAADAAISRVRARGRCEFVTEVAAAIPMPVFMRLAGLPTADIAGLPRYNESLIDAEGNETHANVMGRFGDYLRPHCAARLANPQDDMLSQLVRGRIDGRPMPIEDAVEMATTMFTGGIDTVISSLGLLMAHLAADKPLRARLDAAPDLLPIVVREMLRRYPIMTKARLVTRDVTLDGVTLEAGDMVVAPPLHGLDERIFPDPLCVNIDRPERRNITFGVGVHRCPGKLLALAEIEIVLEAWLAQIPDFALAAGRPPRMQSGVLGALRSLDLVWPT